MAKTVEDLYSSMLEQLLEIRQTLTRRSDIEFFEMEKKRIETHLHRLKTDHADCVERCCIGCKLGGLRAKQTEPKSAR